MTAGGTGICALRRRATVLMIGRSSGPATFKLSANVHGVDEGVHGTAPVGGREHQHLSVTRCRFAATSDAVDMVPRNPTDSQRSFPGVRFPRLNAKGPSAGCRGPCSGVAPGEVRHVINTRRGQWFLGDRLWRQPFPLKSGCREELQVVGGHCRRAHFSGRRPPCNSPAMARFYLARAESRWPADRWIFSH